MPSRSRSSQSYAGLLRDSNYRNLWLAGLGSDLGGAISRVALPLLVYAITGSVGVLGLVFVLTFVPRIVLSPFIGLIIDRYDRRRIVIVADVVRMLLVCLLPFMASAWQIATIAVITAAFSAVAIPTVTATVPMVAGEDRMIRAVSLAQISSAAVNVVGPSIGAALVAILGAGPSFFVQGVCFAISLVFELRLRIPPIENPMAGPDSLAAWWHEMTVGFRVAWRFAAIRGIVGAEAIWGAAGIMMVIGFVAYTERTLDLGDRAGPVFALLTAAFSGGTVLGGLLAPTIEHRFGRRFMLGVGYCAPLLLATIVLVPPLPVTFGILILFGMSDSWLVAASQALVVETIDDAQRGRYYAAFGAINGAAWAAWNGGLGALIDRVGAPHVFLLVGVVAGVGCPLVLGLSGAFQAIGRHRPAPAAID